MEQNENDNIVAMPESNTAKRFHDMGIWMPSRKKIVAGATAALGVVVAVIVVMKNHNEETTEEV